MDQNTINIIKSTAPLLEKEAENITLHFYTRMFSKNPEVLPLFNNSNQKTNNQQKALASAIVAYAKNIDNLDALTSRIELIANKHAALQIKSHHYPIVGENLIASIKEVCEEVATKEVLEAWEKAYWFLANILIKKENEIYHNNATKLGGWEGFREFKVEKKEKESDLITSFYLKPIDKKGIPDYLPGQYITVRVATKDGSTTMRSYSLSDSPNKDYFRISVKKEITNNKEIPNGFVSNLLHNEINVGSTIELSPPCGDFFLKSNDSSNNKTLVLLSGGVGITPILSILLSSIEKNPNRPIIFIHACQDGKNHAFKKTVDELSNNNKNLTVQYCYNDIKDESNIYEKNISKGFITKELLSSLIVPKDGEYYFCGPKIFMINIHNYLLNLGVKESQINLEFFGPLEELNNNQL